MIKVHRVNCDAEIRLETHRNNRGCLFILRVLRFAGNTARWTTSCSSTVKLKMVKPRITASGIQIRGLVKIAQSGHGESHNRNLSGHDQEVLNGIQLVKFPQLFVVKVVGEFRLSSCE